MESLIKQTRARYPGGGQVNQEGSSDKRDTKVAPKRPQSFKGEKIRSQSWIQKQLSGQKVQDYDLSGADHPAAVAAAALAIQSFEASKARHQKKINYEADTSLTKKKSKAEDRPRSHKGSVGLSDEASEIISKEPEAKAPISTSTSTKLPEKAVGLAPFAENSTFHGMDLEKKIISNMPEKAKPRKAVEPALFTERFPTSEDKELKINDSQTPEIRVEKPDRPSIKKSTTQVVETKRQIPTRAGPRDTKADAWEKNEMARIKERYEKLSMKIQNWETSKKKKAKQKLERIEAKLDKRRVKAIKHYRRDVTRIEEISQGATTQAVKNQKNEERKVREKASKIRTTGKLPASCLFF